VQTSLFENSAKAAIATLLAQCFVALGGCGSSEKTPPPAAGPQDTGAEAQIKYLDCDQPQDHLSGVDNAPTGFVICANSNNSLSLHRREVKECATAVPRASTCTGVGSGTDSGAQIGLCRSDADCTAQTQGYCALTSGACSCHAGCKADSDCSADRLCVCGNPTGQCVLAQCRSDADCSPGSLCLSASDGACRRVFACQNPKDACAGDKDCPPSYSQCTLEGDHRVCKAPPNCGSLI
jgi:hypothetical protein